MVLLAIPKTEAFVVDEKSKAALNKKNDAVLTALRRVKKAELSTGNVERLRDLDRKIAALEGR